MERLMVVVLWFAVGFSLFPMSSLAASCGTQFNKVDYAASFTLGEKKATLKVGMAKEGGRLAWLAEIFGEQGCQAVCEVQHFEADKFRNSAPVSLELKCRSQGFAPLETKATIFWKTETQSEPMIRFGSWLNGYQDVGLTIDTDTFSETPARKPLMKGSKLAQIF